MRDISTKINTLRTATARSVLKVSSESMAAIDAGTVPKGNPLDVAKIAAIQAAKGTSTIIPYCHPLPIEAINVWFEMANNTITTWVTVKAIYKTGVEMEALTAASVASLTLYDMLKMLDETMSIGETVLTEKTGGKSQYKEQITHQLRAAVVVMSDSISSGKKTDASGRAIAERLASYGITVEDFLVIPDDPQVIGQAMMKYTDEVQLDLVVTTGGTGLSPRDNTPEVISSLLDREIPGIAEALRHYGQVRTPYAMLSRSLAGVRGKTLILNFPGSTGGVQDAMDALFPSVFHVFKMMWGYGHPSETSKTVPSSEKDTLSHAHL